MGTALLGMKDEITPVKKVIDVPINTYHGHAMRETGSSRMPLDGNAIRIDFANTITDITAMPTPMPIIASRWRARFQKMPRKNPPSRPPYVNEAMASAILTTGVL